MHQNRSISLFPTPFDHFHFHPFPALIYAGVGMGATEKLSQDKDGYFRKRKNSLLALSGMVERRASTAPRPPLPPGGSSPPVSRPVRAGGGTALCLAPDLW